MKTFFISPPLGISDDPDFLHGEPDIHVFTQFFLPDGKDPKRVEELRACLQKNVENPHVTRIHLLNERIYDALELGFFAMPDKIRQVNVGKRLSFQRVFQYIREEGVCGFLVLTNADIFFDDSLQHLQVSTLPEKRQMMAQLRYEYDPVRGCDASPVFGPRFDSQDTWIFHSNFPIRPSQEKGFQFQFGQPGCDNKMVYMASILGYEVINDPRAVKTYHFHRNPARTYTVRDQVKDPWGMVAPVGTNILALPPSLGVHPQSVCHTTHGFQNLMFDDHTVLYDYVAEKLRTGKPFVIPRIAGVENNFAVFARIKRETGRTDFDAFFQQTAPVMKNNAGILASNWDSIVKYSDAYLKAFDQCEVFTGWEVQGNVRPSIAQSHDFIEDRYPGRQVLWAFALDVFHYVHDPKAWTKSLRGKRVLLISPFEESLRDKVPKRALMYDGVDLFPDCTFVYLKPPMTQAGEPSREFHRELADFTRKIDAIKDTFDVALVSCGGYGNLVCSHIYESCGKSAVYVGGVLQMYFGILGGRWLRERPDVVRLYLNEHWSRPKSTERPVGCEKIENACYW